MPWGPLLFAGPNTMYAKDPRSVCDNYMVRQGSAADTEDVAAAAAATPAKPSLRATAA